MAELAPLPQVIENLLGRFQIRASISKMHLHPVDISGKIYRYVLQSSLVKCHTLQFWWVTRSEFNSSYHIFELVDSRKFGLQSFLCAETIRHLPASDPHHRYRLVPVVSLSCYLRIFPLFSCVFIIWGGWSIIFSIRTRVRDTAALSRISDTERRGPTSALFPQTDVIRILNRQRLQTDLHCWGYNCSWGFQRKGIKSNLAS